MKNYFALQLQTTNAAFTGQGLPEEELSRILNDTAERIADSIETCYGFIVKDINGNTVGTVTRLLCTERPKLSNAKLGDFNLRIECDNAAFFDDDGTPNNKEIARIIKSITNNLKDLAKANEETKKLRDFNGNTVGEVQWGCFMEPAIHPTFTLLLDAADTYLGEYIDLYDALVFNKDELVSFIDAHSVFNALHDQTSDTFSINEIEESVGNLLSLDNGELAAAILTYQANKTAIPKLVGKATNNLIDAAKNESDHFALDNEEADEVQKDICSFKEMVRIYFT